MREVVRLNRSAEAQCQGQEIYRVKLVNADLCERLKRLQGQVNSQSIDN